MPPISDEDMALLTEEELAGLTDDDDDGDDSAATDAGDAAAEDGDDEGGDDGAAGDDGTDGDEGAAAAGKDGDDGDDGEEGDSAPVLAPPTDRVDPKAVEDEIAEIAKSKEALEEQLDNGDLTTKEFVAALSKLNGDENQLTAKLQKQQDYDTSVETAWFKDVNRFLVKYPELNANQTRLRSFDEVVHRVTGDPANHRLSNGAQLAKARDIWREELGIVDPPKAEPKPKPGEKVAAKPARRAKPELPPTLHNVPAADIDAADDGKYNYLDALLNAGRTIEYEDAMGKLSEADQQEYLSRA